MNTAPNSGNTIPGRLKNTMNSLWGFAASRRGGVASELPLQQVIGRIRPFFHSSAYANAVEREFASVEAAVHHYLTWGEADGVWPNDWFDVGWYKKKYAEWLFAQDSPFDHYLLIGAAKGLSPNAACWLPERTGLPEPSEFNPTCLGHSVSETELRS